MSEPRPDLAAVYADVRIRLTELVRPLDGAAVNTAVPATPAWRVRDSVAHVTGVIADLLAGNLAGVGSDEWTAAQVEARRDVGFSEVLDEWATKGPALEATLNDAPPEMAALLIGDCASHAFDVRGALGNRDERDSAATAIGVHLSPPTRCARPRSRSSPRTGVTSGRYSTTRDSGEGKESATKRGVRASPVHDVHRDGHSIGFHARRGGGRRP